MEPEVKTTMDLKTATEAQLRDADVPWPKSLKGLSAYIRQLVERDHDYGTCVYAMSMAATAAFYFVSGQLGVTGFQASCADLDIVRRTRHMKLGFKIIDYADLLYPQYEAKIPGFWQLIKENAATLAPEAAHLIAESDKAHPGVKAHWIRLAAMKP